MSPKKRKHPTDVFRKDITDDYKGLNQKVNKIYRIYKIYRIFWIKLKLFFEQD